VARSRVLLVDDEPDILSSLKTFLEGSMPVDVVALPSASAALTAMGSTDFDLVVSDFRMPDMDGLRFLRLAGRIHPDVPRVLMTAFPDMQLALDALNEASIRQFLTKPVDPDRLVDLVGGLVAERTRGRMREDAFERATGARHGRIEAAGLG
jgi:DNA-binding NtrC family response regulator